MVIMIRKTSYMIAMAFFIVALATYQDPVSANSAADLDKKIQELEKEQAELREKNSDITGEKGNTESKMDENVNEQNKVEQEINIIDEKLHTTRNGIDELETEISETNNEIESLSNRITELKDEIEVLQERIKKRDLLLKDRLKAIQKTGGPMKYIGVILGSQNFSDFINRSSAVNTIMDQDKTIMEEQEADKLALEDKKEEIEANKVKVEEKKLALEDSKKELVALEKTLDSQIAEKETLMAELEVEYEELEEYKLSLEEEQQLLDDQEAAIKKAKQLAEDEKEKLAQLAREQEAERKKKAAESSAGSNGSTPNTSSGNGIFIRPAPGGSGPNSGFGWRTHPISGNKKFHNGLDIQAGSGTPVSAAASGVVATAGWMGGYGNTVTITHIIDGKSYTTLYAHLSHISVTAGQVVNQGEKIGEVGSTGNSTGPHLHFEVHPGGLGNPQNPLNYF